MQLPKTNVVHRVSDIVYRLSRIGYRLPRHAWWYLLVLAAVAWRTIYAYWTPLVNKYVVPPGDDGPFHIGMVSEILSGQIQLFHGSYPLGFHLITAGIAKIAGWDALTAINLVSPALLVLPVFALFWAGKQIFNSPVAGAFAALFWGFLALAPVRSLANGNYPNLLAGSFLVPIVIALLMRAIGEWPNWKRSSVVMAGCGMVLIPLFHHLSTVYFALAALPPVLWRAASGLFDTRTRWAVLRLVFGSAVMAGALILFLRPFYGELVQSFLGVLLAEQSLASVFGPLSRPITWPVLLEQLGPLSVALGLAGLAATLVSRLDRLVKVLFLGWIGLLWWASTNSAFGDPGRFVRELAVPFALTGGYLVAFLAERAPTRIGKAALITLFIATIGVSWQQSFNRPFALPDPFKPLIRVQHEEEPAFPVLIQVTPEDGVILANNSNFYLPFLVGRRVVFVTHPSEVAALLAREPITTIYIGSRPPLTPEHVYTMFAYFDEIRDTLLSIPNKELVERLPTGTEIYRLTR